MRKCSKANPKCSPSATPAQDAQAMLDYMVRGPGNHLFGPGARGVRASFPLEKERAYLAPARKPRRAPAGRNAPGEIAGSSHCPSGDRALPPPAELALSVRQGLLAPGAGPQADGDSGEPGAAARALKSSAWRWTRKTCGPWGCTSAGALPWRAHCAESSKMADGSYRDLYVMGKFLDR